MRRSALSAPLRFSYAASISLYMAKGIATHKVMFFTLNVQDKIF